MIIIYLSLFVCLIGALIHVMATNGRVAELGRLMFGIGLFWFLSGGERILQVLPR